MNKYPLSQAVLVPYWHDDDPETYYADGTVILITDNYRTISVSHNAAFTYTVEELDKWNE